MGLFGRLFRKSGDRERDGAHRCMECGMTGGEHTDWCPVASEKDVDGAPGTVPEGGSEDEGRAEPHP